MSFINLLWFDFSLFLICLDISTTIYLLGILGVIINRRNFLITLLSLEICFFCNCFIFILTGIFMHNVNGFIYGILVIILVVLDTVLGLSILIINYKVSRKDCIRGIVTLRG